MYSSNGRSSQFLLKILPVLFIVAVSGCTTNHSRFDNFNQDYCSTLPQATAFSLTEHLAQLTENKANKTGVYVLEQGDEALISRAWLAEHAEQTIDVQYFIFSPDNLGLISVDYLVRAAERGVKVRILVDDIMVQATGYELSKLDFHKNLSVKIYNPKLNIGKNIAEKIFNVTTDFHGINQRMHNKTLTIDNKVVITGGRNIADEYFGYDKQYNFRDRDVLLIGGITSGVQKSFNEFWSDPLSVPVSQLIDKQNVSTDSDVFESLHQYACNSDNYSARLRKRTADIPDFFKINPLKAKVEWIEGVEYISDQPGKNTAEIFLGGGGATTDRLISLLKNAKKSVIIQTPYLITTDLGKSLFRGLIEKGVAVTILTNSLATTDNFEAFNGYQRDRKQLLETGVRIFEVRPDAQIRIKFISQELQKDQEQLPVFGLHAKTMVIDDRYTIIGTFNLDPRSANLNTEGITIIPSRSITANVKQGIEEELKPENAWETTLDWNPDSKAESLKQLRVKLRRIVPKGIL
jgi:phosphatidylserine/phosphatidylglycerophosphate/cardiolipin synthase-like enzyme